ncbi:hypothetical protein CRUP_038588, partial [Coryphaenoides rupestris]
CEEDVDECEQEVCENGGICVNTLGGFSCNCSLGFTGRSCQEVSDEDATQMVGVGVLVFVVAVLLILFAGLRRKISPPRKGAESEGRALGVSTVTSEAGYMLQQAGTDFKAARLSVGSSPGDSGCLGNGGPPQVMVRPNCHSPRRHGDRAGEWAVSSEGSQLSSFLSDASHLRGGAGSRRGVAVCSVAPNLPPASQRHSELSPAHKVPWEAAGGRRGRGREQDWGRRALEAEQTQRGEEAPGVQEESRCFSEASSVSSFTSESFDDDASVVTVVRLVSDAPGDAAESPAYRWSACSQTSMWLPPPVELTSHSDLSEAQEAIRRAGSMASLQLDSSRLGGPGAFCLWGGGPSDGDEDGASPVYEECGRPRAEPESTYDTLPPARRAYEGPPPAPPLAGLHLHPAQLRTPLRARAGGQTQAVGHRGPENGPVEPGAPGRAGDELERLLNLVSLRARRATRTHRASTGSEPPRGWEGL